MKSIIASLFILLCTQNLFAQCYPVYVKMKDQPVSGALSNEVFRSPYAFYYTVSAYDGHVFDIWDGNQWTVLALPTDIKFSKGSNVSITKFNNTIIGSGPIKSFNNMVAPKGKFFKYIQYNNGVWDTLPGGMVDTAMYYYTSNAFATEHNLFYSETDLTGTYRGFINKYDTSLQKFVRILSYNEGLYGAHIACGANRVLIGNVSRVDLTIPNGFCYIDGDSIKLNLDSTFDKDMIYGLDMSNDHIYAFERKSNPLVLEFGNQFISSRKTRLDYKIGNGDVQVYNDKLIWNAGNQYVLCKGETDWKKVSSDVQNANITRSGVYAKDNNSRNIMELSTGSRITGYAYFDLDSNCNRDSFNEPVLKRHIISAKSDLFQASAITDDSGRYELFVYPDSFAMSGPGALSKCFPKKVILMTAGITSAKDIPVLKPDFYDLKVKFLNGSAVRWNSKTSFDVLVENRGLPYDSAYFEFNIDPRLKIMAGDSNVIYFNDSTARGQINNLGYFDKRIVRLSVWVDSGNAKINSNVCNKFSAYLYTYEKDTLNNKDNLCQKVVYSLDPNHKDCNKEVIPVTGSSKLEYFIGFQNEGNDFAEDVVVIDTLSTLVLPETLEIYGASHPYTMTLEGRILKLTFRNINLQPKNVNETQSQGFFKFSINTLKNQKDGDSITNMAYIYFDLNKPVLTNTSVVRISKDAAGITTKDYKTENLVIYPNPSQGLLHINFTESATISIYTMKGELIYSGICVNGSLELNITSWSAGLYLVRSGTQTGKVLKTE